MTIITDLEDAMKRAIDQGATDSDSEKADFCLKALHGICEILEVANNDYHVPVPMMARSLMVAVGKMVSLSARNELVKLTAVTELCQILVDVAMKGEDE